MSKLLEILKRQWFLAVLFGCLAAAFALPATWAANLQRIDLRWVIMLVMFLMSLSLKLGDIAASFRRGRPLGTALAGGYLVLPLLMFGISHLPGFGADIRVGLLVVAAGPTTLASAAIWTRLAGGNDALSLATTIISNGMNFLVAPAILVLLAGQIPGLEQGQIGEMAVEMGWKLFQVIVIPVVGGQLARALLGARADGLKTVTGVLSRLLILTVVLISVSKAAGSGERSDVPVLALLQLVVAVTVAHGLALAACWWGSGALGAERADRIAATFSGAQKTLPVGLYLASEFFPGKLLAQLPILFYHASQLILDSLLIERFRGGPEAGNSKDSETASAATTETNG